MGEYHSYSEILNFMDRIPNFLPNQAKVRLIGQTVEGREIRGIQFGRPNNLTRTVIWIDAGIHSREWTAIHTAIYFIQHIANELLINKSQLARYLDTIDIIIFPCLNPDGYEYTKTNPQNPSVRFWRKNRSLKKCAVSNKKNITKCCKGVDLNRNFDYRFAEIGTSFYPCSEIFHGSDKFSEPETKAIRDAILFSDLKNRLAAFVSLHAYSQLWIYPFSHKKFVYPTDINDLKSVAEKAVKAISVKFGTTYTHGTGPEIIYAYTGGSSDWAKETAKIKYTYTLELRPALASWNGFILEREQLIPTARETFDGMMVIFEAVLKDLDQNTPKELYTNFTLKSNQNFDKQLIQNKLNVVDTSKCDDKIEYCQKWIKNNSDICQLSKYSMEQSCRKSCHFC